MIDSHGARAARAAAWLTAVAVAVATPAEAARAQAGGGELVGTWKLVSEVAHKGGKTSEPLGHEPVGILMMDASGRFSLLIARQGLPRFKAGRREAGTAAENQAVLAGLLAFFGTYTVEAGVLKLRPQASTFPNWVGAEQLRSFTLSGNEMRWTNRSPAIGAEFVEVVWRREG